MHRTVNAIVAFLLIGASTASAPVAAAEADCAKAADRGACLSDLVSAAIEAMTKKLAAISDSIKGDDAFVEEFHASQASWENYRDKTCEFVWNARDGSPAQVADSEECELILTRERTILLGKI